MSYKVETLDLSAAAERRQLVPHNTAVASVAVLRLTGGGANPPELALGAGQMFPVYAGLAVDLCPAELEGIFFTNGTPGAGSIVLLISYGGLSARQV